MYDTNTLYSIADTAGNPITTNGVFFANLDDAINDAKKSNDMTLYGMIQDGFSVLYKNTNTDTIKRVLLSHNDDIRTSFYATNDGVVISNVHDNPKTLLNELYGRNYTPVYMAIHNDFKICIDTMNADTDETTFEPIEHLEIKIYDALLKE